MVVKVALSRQCGMQSEQNACNRCEWRGLVAQGPNPEKAMQLEKMRIVMDRSGIKRLEPCGNDALLAKVKHLPFAQRGHHH